VIGLGDVLFEANGLAFDQGGVVGGGFGAKGFKTLGGMVGLRAVDADVAEWVDLAGDFDADGVTIGDFDDAGVGEATCQLHCGCPGGYLLVGVDVLAGVIDANIVAAFSRSHWLRMRSARLPGVEVGAD